MAITDRAKQITDGIYHVYGSYSGYLFGIEPDKRCAVEAIVQFMLDQLAPNILDPNPEEIEE